MSPKVISNISKSNGFVNVATGGYKNLNAIYIDKQCNTLYGTVKTTSHLLTGFAGGMVGTEIGAKIGFSIGACFGGVGVLPGTLIGGAIGGLVGTFGASEVSDFIWYNVFINY